ncbi:unnamed protein product, partial [Symbiodinium sp. KB8]
ARGAPDGAPPGDASPGSDAGSDLLAFPGGSMPPGCCQLGRVVVIDDLDAFDDLTERGFALLDMAALTRRQARRLLAPPGGARRPPEEGSAAAPPRGGGEDHVSEGATGRGGGQGASPEAAAAGAGEQHPVLPLPGERLRLAFTVSVWDGGSLAAADVQRVRRAAVTLPFPEQAEAAAGALPEGLRALPGEPEAQDDIDAAAAAARHGMELYRALPLPLGLYPALSMLPYGHGARVVLAPEAAFGEVALPPLIPAEAYLVYDVSLAPAQPELLQRRREQGTLRQSAADVARARVGGRPAAGSEWLVGAGSLDDSGVSWLGAAAAEGPAAQPDAGGGPAAAAAGRVAGGGLGVVGGAAVAGSAGGAFAPRPPAQSARQSSARQLGLPTVEESMEGPGSPTWHAALPALPPPPLRAPAALMSDGSVGSAPGSSVAASGVTSSGRGGGSGGSAGGGGGATLNPSAISQFYGSRN